MGRKRRKSKPEKHSSARGSSFKPTKRKKNGRTIFRSERGARFTIVKGKKQYI